MSSKKGRPRRTATANYEVGYCRTPVHTRFKPGISGNASGRKRPAPSTGEIIENLLRRKVEVTTDGGARKMTLDEVRLHALLKKAVAGDLKAIALIEKYRLPVAQVLDVAPSITDEEDEELITAALKRRGES